MIKPAQSGRRTSRNVSNLEKPKSHILPKNQKAVKQDYTLATYIKKAKLQMECSDIPVLSGKQ